VFDEIHEFGSDSIIELYLAGTKARRQTLALFGTNAGEGKTNIGWNYHEHATAVARGDTEDHNYFPMVFSCDDGDDPMEDDECWIKANPSIPITPTKKYLRKQVDGAKNIPSRAAFVRRLNFAEWIENASVWIDAKLVDNAMEEETPADAESGQLFIGLDLSATTDLTAMALVWRNAGRIYSRVEFFVPEEGILDRSRFDNVPYDMWRDMGYITATPGRRVNYSFVAERILLASAKYDLCGIAFDAWRMADLMREFREMNFQHFEADAEGHSMRSGVPLYAHPQSYNKRFGRHVKAAVIRDGVKLLHNGLTDALWMPGSITRLESLLLDGSIRMKMNPCLRWNILSATTTQDALGNRRFEKDKSHGRIDGLVALAMATGLAKVFPIKTKMASMGFVA